MFLCPFSSGKFMMIMRFHDQYKIIIRVESPQTCTLLGIALVGALEESTLSPMLFKWENLVQS